MRDQRRPDRCYETLKQRLWNQPRALKFLEPLERHHARPSLLERVAGLFLNGPWGKAEIRAAYYAILLKHRDRADVQKRIAALRVTSLKIPQGLIATGDHLRRLKDGGFHQILGYPDWHDFMERELDLTGQIASLLAAAGKPIGEIGLDEFFKRIHGVTPDRVPEHRPDFVRTIKRELQGHGEAERRGNSTEALTRLSELKWLLLSIQQDLLRMADELSLFRSREGYRTAGHEDFHAFAGRELGLSGRLADTLVLIGEERDRISLGEILRIVIEDSRPDRKGEDHGRRAS